MFDERDFFLIVAMAIMQPLSPLNLTIFFVPFGVTHRDVTRLRIIQARISHMQAAARTALYTHRALFGYLVGDDDSIELAPTYGAKKRGER
jgi:hypothetical protein